MEENGDGEGWGREINDTLIRILNSQFSTPAITPRVRNLRLASGHSSVEILVCAAAPRDARGANMSI